MKGNLLVAITESLESELKTKYENYKEILKIVDDIESEKPKMKIPKNIGG